jgi:hypothetical protein
MGNSKDTWKQHVCRYSIRHQLRWKTNLVRTFITDEKQYYLEVLRFSRTQYMVRANGFFSSRSWRDLESSVWRSCESKPWILRSSFPHWKYSIWCDICVGVGLYEAGACWRSKLSCLAVPVPHRRCSCQGPSSDSIQVLFGNDVWYHVSWYVYLAQASLHALD